jgi:hypothetical protein
MLAASRCLLQSKGHPRHALEKEPADSPATSPCTGDQNSRKFHRDLVKKQYNLVKGNVLQFSIQKINQFNDE